MVFHILPHDHLLQLARLWLHVAILSGYAQEGGEAMRGMHNGIYRADTSMTCRQQ